MKETETTTQKPILVKIADQLLKSQQDLDELALQLSLGKAEVKDKFEEAKKQLKTDIREFKEELDADYKQSKDWAKETFDELTDLESLLDKGKAETKEVFEEQKKNIIYGLENVKNAIKKNPEVIKMGNYFTSAVERIQLQMALFQMNLNSDKKELTKEFKHEMNAAKTKINSIITKIQDAKDNVDLKLDHFNNEIELSYEHLKKAIKAL